MRHRILGTPLASATKADAGNRVRTRKEIYILDLAFEAHS